MKTKIELSFEELKDSIEQGDNLGFCVWCGEEHSGVEPDATGYKCENCGALGVVGAFEVMNSGQFSFSGRN